jgi:hypothetical protein
VHSLESLTESKFFIVGLAGEAEDAVFKGPRSLRARDAHFPAISSGCRTITTDRSSSGSFTKHYLHPGGVYAIPGDVVTRGVAIFDHCWAIAPDT